MDFMKWDKIGIFCRRSSVWHSGSEAAFEQRCEKGVHQVYGGCFAGEGLYHENGDHRAGKCRGRSV